MLWHGSRYVGFGPELSIPNNTLLLSGTVNCLASHRLTPKIQRQDAGFASGLWGLKNQGAC